VITQIPEAAKFIIGQTLLDDRSQTLLRLSQTYRMKVTFLKFQQIGGFCAMFILYFLLGFIALLVIGIVVIGLFAALLTGVLFKSDDS
jgi:hypothetical protein